MAVIFQNPIIVTAVMNSGYKSLAQAQGYGSFFVLRVTKIYWFAPANVRDNLLIVDPASNSTLLPAACEVALQSQLFDFTARPKMWSDFQISTLQSGTVYIYLD